MSEPIELQVAKMGEAVTAIDHHHHKQVALEVNGQRATVDEGMAPVLRLLWERDIRTIASCQSDPQLEGRANIGFASGNDFMTFIGMLSLWLLGEGGARFGHVWDSMPEMLGIDLPPGWSVSGLIAADGPLEVGPKKLSLAVILAFPPGDLKHLRKQLARRRP